MNGPSIRVPLLVALASVFGFNSAQAQVADFNIGGRDVVMHGFLAEGYMKSDGNNFITAQTGAGTFLDAEGALNIATNLTDNLHIGAQVYARDIGRLGAGKPQLDWAYADYKIKDWLGFRGGKVKTPLGLYNDTQDMEFLYPWVLLPQSVYPSDLRSVTIAHTGGDVYGSIGLDKAGSVSYQAYGGTKPADMQSGFVYGLTDSGFRNITLSGTEAGYDIRWKTPVKGLRVGTSYMWFDMPIGASLAAGKASLPGSAEMHSKQYAGYGDYRYRGLTLATEYRPESRITPLAFDPIKAIRVADYKSYFVSAAYRFNQWLQLGTYNSRFQMNAVAVPGLLAGADSHIDDQVVTARFDFWKYCDFKVEGHFMNGVGSPISAHGFYLSDNPQGLKPNTKLLAIRLEFNL
ncbi:MAG: hypothetical protein ACLQVN_12450 [Bryobacteraceae bacterium]